MKNTRLLPILTVLFAVFSAGNLWADPSLSDRENYQEGIKLHQQGKYRDAYEFYFKDMTQTPKTRKWLRDYEEQYLSGKPVPAPETSEPAPEAKTAARQPLERYFFFGPGMSTPMGPEGFGDYWKTGAAFGGGFGFGVSRITTFVVSFDYATFPADKNHIAYLYGGGYYDIQVTGGTCRSFLAMASAKIKFSSREPSVLGYFTGGFGIGTMGGSDMRISDGVDHLDLFFEGETKPALRTGLGIDFKVGPKTKLFIESNGVYVFTEGETTAYGVLKAGLLFRYGRD